MISVYQDLVNILDALKNSHLIKLKNTKLNANSNQSPASCLSAVPKFRSTQFKTICQHMV